MSSMIDEPMMAAPPPPIMMPPALRTYSFSVLCKSGSWREFTCQAEDFVAARRLLDTFKEEN